MENEKRRHDITRILFVCPTSWEWDPPLLPRMEIYKITITNKRKKKEISGQLPSSWEEVKKGELLEILRLAGKEKTTEAQLELLEIWIPKKYLRLLPPEALVELVEKIGWIWEEPLAEQVIPSWEVAGIKYLTPAGKMENASCLEWLLAEEYYARIIQEPNEENITLLLATLCREADKDLQGALARDDRRVKLLSRSEAEERAKALQSAPENLKLYILAFFSGCKKWVYETYKPWLFQEVEEGEEPPAPATITERLGWYAVFQEVAEIGVFGNLPQVLTETKFKDVCLFLIAKKEQHEEQKKRQRKNVNHENL